MVIGTYGQSAAVMRPVTDAGLRIPGDVRIAGFDADTANRYGQIILTTVQQPIELITRRALDRLLEEGAGSAIDTESAPKALVA
jgi:LacI family transcriptional regulator